jgi:hypothetical protein
MKKLAWLPSFLLLRHTSCPGTKLQQRRSSAIPDHGIPLRLPLIVSGLSAPLSDTFGLEQVCLDIQHQHDADLSIYLMSPDGTIVELVSGTGGAGRDFLHTCLSMSASTLIATMGSAPFAGTYVPRHPLGSFNNGRCGKWTMVPSGDRLCGGRYRFCILIFPYNSVITRPRLWPYLPGLAALYILTLAFARIAVAIAACCLPDMFIATSMLADTLDQLDTLGPFVSPTPAPVSAMALMEPIRTGHMVFAGAPW